MSFGVRLFRMEFMCRRCGVRVRVDRRDGDEDVLPRGWMIRVIPNCGLTNYTKEEANCVVCAALPDEGTRLREPARKATVVDDPEPLVLPVPGESRRLLDI